MLESSAAQPAAEPYAVSVTGAYSDRDQQYAADKIRLLAGYTRRSLTSAHVVIDHAANAASSWKVKASASVTIGSRHLHASAEGENFQYAVDTLYQRLRAQLTRQGR